ncbi:mirror-image polydactyly gene 1 protein isoform X1 [Electrophorus electricus]|uniref:mirror-image polydactyly gene 1 protein isoform X1 n=1 Tax=Electrophorus electricus TaxID=8005 RepID=UPI0015D01C91|nr:mirror-image polydactyly gene 1 protein isoform X1 [Electrophorus electricus]
MYKANPKVNEELKQRLPSPVKRHCSETTPQLGLSGCSSPDISQSASEKEALDKRFIKELNTLRFGEGPGAGVPPPPPPPAIAGSMEEGKHPSRALLQKGQDGEELDGGPIGQPQLINPLPTVPRGVTEKDHGNSKVSCDTKRQIPVFSREKNIAFLLKELDSLRVLNKKLQDKLALREKELETMRLDKQLQDADLESRACERAAVLVEEVYKAQRERDQAVMARLRLANEERDEALLRAKKLQEAAMELENINPEESDMDLEELLHRVSSADSALSIERSGMAILERIQRARERRSKITSEEMRAVIEERDKALSRCKRLEQELLYSRELSQTTTSHLVTTHHQEQEHKVELKTVQRERDMAVEVCRRLEEELRSLRRYHSTQQSQMEESGRKEASSWASPTQAKEGPVTPTPALLSRVQLLTTELQGTKTQLHLVQEAEREATEKVQKLERLVEVLRKKVGTGSVRTVI